ncbi:MAG TPA: VOC family protein [Thermoanaerobaculia bacterium]|nr:VOC family protein [Thermoanaerobaculia bacterium]
MAFIPHHIDHVEVFVRDLDDAVRWYGEILGLKGGRPLGSIRSRR